MTDTMAKVSLGVGLELDVVVHSGPRAGRHRARVLRLEPEGAWLVPAEDPFEPLPAGTEVSLLWGQSDRLRSTGYTLATIVRESTVEATVVDVPDEVERIERRRMVRVDCKLRVRMRRSDELSWVEGACVSLSGTGMRVELKAPFVGGAKIEAEVFLSSGAVRTLGYVVRCAPVGVVVTQ